MRNLAYVPLDLPVLHLDREFLLSFIDQAGQNCKARSIHTARGTKVYYLTENQEGYDPYYNSHVYSLSWRWKEAACEHLRAIKEWVEYHLPFDVITEVSIASNFGRLMAHRDDTPQIMRMYVANYEEAMTNVAAKAEIEPSTYRVQFAVPGEKSFFVTREKYHSPIIHTRLPEDSNSFVFNDQDYWHGADIPEIRKVMLRLAGKVNPEKHAELVSRSFEKYKDYAVVF